MEQQTHYDNLKVAKNAPASVIKAAYKALIQIYHPDKYQGSRAEAERIIKIINTSYEVLIDHEKRAKHDQWIEKKEQIAKQQRESRRFDEFAKSSQQKANKDRDDEDNSRTKKVILLTNADWIRFFTRLFDLWWEITFIAYGLTFLLDISLINLVDRSPVTAILIVLLSLPAALLLDAIVFSLFGNTPGKAWLGIKVSTDTGLSLSFSQYMRRNFKLYVCGLALGLPVIAFFPLIHQTKRLSRGLQTSYDEATGNCVILDSTEWPRRTLFGCVFSCFFILTFPLRPYSQPIEVASLTQHPSSISKSSLNHSKAPPTHKVVTQNSNIHYIAAIDSAKQENTTPCATVKLSQSEIKKINLEADAYDYSIWNGNPFKVNDLSFKIQYKKTEYPFVYPTDYEMDKIAGSIESEALKSTAALDFPRNIYSFEIINATKQVCEKANNNDSVSLINRLAELSTQFSENSRAVIPYDNKENKTTGAVINHAKIQTGNDDDSEALFLKAADLYDEGKFTRAISLFEYLAELEYIPAKAYLEKINHKCVIKPVMTKAEIDQCKS